MFSEPVKLLFFTIAALNILPILMTIAMFLQQKLMPKATDEQSRQQQKFMAFLPLMFVVLFYNFPSGLCLYWFTSTMMGMGEQYFIRRHLDAMEEAAPAIATKGGKKRKRK